MRAFTAPFPSLKALSFEAEYALEDNGDALDSTAWNVLAGYQFEGGWKPKLSYRYAFFEGDDPATPKNEAFDGLLTGFYDWGTWWQGEIAGEYFVSNSNLISHQLRVHLEAERVHRRRASSSTTSCWTSPRSAGVTSNAVATELDWYMDWSVNDNFIVSFVAAYADPGAAVEQSSGRTDSFCLRHGLRGVQILITQSTASAIEGSRCPSEAVSGPRRARVRARVSSAVRCTCTGSPARGSRARFWRFGSFDLLALDASCTGSARAGA